MLENKPFASLLPCPFCGASASGHEIEPHQHSAALLALVPDMPKEHHGSYVIEGNCQCGAGLIGDSQGEVTARWNSRALNPLMAKTACCMGVGNGDSNLFVYGDYDSIKAAQALVLRAGAKAGAQAELVAMELWKALCDSRATLHAISQTLDDHELRGAAKEAYEKASTLTRPSTAPQAQPADAPIAYLQESDQHLLHRFIETTEDDESFDIGKDAVKRLANLGVVESCGFGRYGVTMFGYWVHEHYWHQNPSLPLKTNADRDREHRAAMAAAQEGGNAAKAKRN